MTTYIVTLSERFWARTEVEASSVEEAHSKATAKLHADLFNAIEHCDGPSEILEFAGPEFAETECTNESQDHD